MRKKLSSRKERGDMNSEELEAIKTEAEQTTPGPWEAHAHLPDWGFRAYYFVCRSGCSELDPPVAVFEGGIMSPRRTDEALFTEIARRNAEFIAHAREYVPKLATEVQRLQEERTGLLDKLGSLKDAMEQADGEVFRPADPYARYFLVRDHWWFRLWELVKGDEK
jgi:hypothetical protein